MRVTSFETLSMLRLVDEKGNTVVELNFNSIPSASNSEASDDESTKGYETQRQPDRIEVREIPQNKEIVGLYCNTGGDQRYIKCLGFIVW